MATLDNRHKSSEDANPCAKEVDALLKCPIESILQQTEKHLRRTLDPSFRHTSESRIKTLRVHKAAIQARISHQGDKKDPQPNSAIVDANVLSKARDLIKKCDQVIKTPERPLPLDDLLKTFDQAEDLRLLTRLYLVVVSSSFLAPFLIIGGIPSALAFTSAFCLLAALMVASFYHRPSRMHYLQGVWIRTIAFFKSLAVSLGARESLHPKQRGWKSDISPKGGEKQCPDVDGHAEYIDDVYSDEKTREHDLLQEYESIYAAHSRKIEDYGDSIQPCTDEGGDAYFIGDAYSETDNTFSQEWPIGWHGLKDAKYVQHGDSERNPSDGRPNIPSQELDPARSVDSPSSHRELKRNVSQPAFQRLKRNRQDVESVEGKFPCIYFVGDESGCFASHTKKHAFISQLL